MVRRSGYQPDNFGNLWICLVRGVCHAGSVTYDINRHLPEPLPYLRRPVLVGLFHEEKWRFYVTNIFEISFTPQFIYELYVQRWQVEIFFNLIKNVLSLENIASKTKNGIMIEIYSALILYLLTRIVIALAAKKIGRSIHEFSFERAHKLIRSFMLTNFHLFLHPSLQAVERIFQQLIDMVATMGLAASAPKIVELNQHFA